MEGKKIYPETYSCDRSRAELRNYKVYGNERSDCVYKTSRHIQYSLEDAVRVYIFSIKQGLDCTVLYDKVLKAAMEALEAHASAEEKQVVRDCNVCFRNNVQISPKQYEVLFPMIQRLCDNMLFVMDYLKAAGMDQFDIRSNYWLENIPEDFWYRYNYKMCAEEGYKSPIIL